MKFLVSSPAEEDAAAAIRYYEDIRPGLASDFLDELDATYSRIRHWPFLFETVRGAIRRAVLQHYHYYVIYRVERDTIQVLAVTPHAMDPAHAVVRLRDFGEG